MARRPASTSPLTIRYGTMDCDLGRILLAATGKGVCAAAVGESDGRLVERLRAEFPGAMIEHDPAALAPWLDDIRLHLAGVLPKLDIPLDVRGTKFQLRVWNAMRKIPYGQSRSYREVAASIGEPLAARGVARACATNPALIVIPCHRVVGANGSVRGRPHDALRRRKLLERERQNSRQ